MKRNDEIRKGIIPKKRVHLSTNSMYLVVASLCHFILREVISPEGKCFDSNGLLATKHRSLCEWASSRAPYEPNVLEKDDDYALGFI